MKILMTLALMVNSVTDGDTLKACCYKKEPITIRLAGIDCPEKNQPFGTHATAYTLGMVDGKRINAVIYKKDLYGRYIADVHYYTHHLNRELMANGLCWSYYPVKKEDSKFELQARASMIGLWALPNPIPPWEWRKGKR